MPGQNLVFYGTTGAGGAADGGAQSNPALYLGRFRSSTKLAAVTSTLTASQTAQSRHYIVDSARIGDGAGAHNMKWILIQTGPAALSPARVEAFDSATGTFKLDRPTTANAVSGNAYSIFAKNNVWPDVTAAEALTGHTRFRSIFLRNEQGASITLVRFHLAPLSTDPTAIYQMPSGKNSASVAFLQRADDTTDILNAFGQRDTLGVGSDSFETANGWDRPMSRNQAATDEVASVTNNQGCALWLKRTIPAGLRLRRSVAVMMVCSTSFAGSDPNPLVGACIMPYDILGTPTASLEGDRFARVGGGIRYKGTVVDATTGVPIAGRPVQIRVQAGDQGSIVTEGDPLAGYDTTDAEGEVGATYYIPEGATPGVPNSVELVVGAGDELPDP